MHVRKVHKEKTCKIRSEGIPSESSLLEDKATETNKAVDYPNH
jgi:hypothetical protein